MPGRGPCRFESWPSGIRACPLSIATRQDTRTQEWINYLLVGMIVAFTAISVVNTLAMATASRRREFGLQRLTGATREQVLRMMAVEGALVAAIGILLGTALDCGAGSLQPR
jgi:putative ABC transport system permease protein